MNESYENKYDFFISYSSKDENFAMRIEKDLVDNGYIVYRDKTRLRYGEDFRHQLMQAIRSSVSLIVIWSDDSNKSEYVPSEVDLAKKYGKIIFPIIIDECIPFGYGNNHSFILNDSGYDLIVSSICDAIEKMYSVPDHSDGFLYNAKFFLKWAILKSLKWVLILLILLLITKFIANGERIFSKFPYPPNSIKGAPASDSSWLTSLLKPQECYKKKRPQITKKLDLTTEAWKEEVSLYCVEREFGPVKYVILKSASKAGLDELSDDLAKKGEFKAIGHVSVEGERFYVTKSTFGRQQDPRFIVILR